MARPQFPFVVVEGSNAVAAFVDELEACEYARRVSAAFRCLTQVFHKRPKRDEPIAQYLAGRVTREFAPQEEARAA